MNRKQNAEEENEDVWRQLDDAIRRSEELSKSNEEMLFKPEARDDGCFFVMLIPLLFAVLTAWTLSGCA
jgi:hypothetical protein